MRATVIVRRGEGRPEEPQGENYPLLSGKRSSHEDTDIFLGSVLGCVSWAERCQEGSSAKVGAQGI